MWHLVQENCDRRNDSYVVSNQVRCADREAVGEVVGKISRKIQVASHFNITCSTCNRRRLNH